jgi:hypothetical protein
MTNAEWRMMNWGTTPGSATPQTKPGEHCAFIIFHSSFIIRHSSFIIHHSSFVIRHSSFVIRHSSFVIHHSSFIIRHSSFVIHPSSFSRIAPNAHASVHNPHATHLSGVIVTRRKENLDSIPSSAP